MHELSIAQSIVDIVEETMNGEPETNLIEVVVDVGELVAVVPESLEFCYAALTDSTKYAGSKLVINILPVLARCDDCRQEFKVENITFVCPNCNSVKLKIFQGQELKISHLEVQ